MEVVARHHETGEAVRVRVDGDRIAEVERVDEEPDWWIAPAFWDVQTNGRWGVSFASGDLTVEQAAEVVLAQAALGTARLCPTLITASREVFLHGLKTIAAACRRWPEIDRMIAGIHLEGPSISERDGYRGAHPIEAVRDPDLDEFERFQAASGERVAIVTLAPERRGAIEFVRHLARSGVVVSLGHTAADSATIHEAAAAGATLSTHLGNGIASPLARHPNPIWDQAAHDGLSASFIADGHHLDDATLSVLVRAKSIDRTILVSDAGPLAGLPPGDYGAWSVHPEGKIVVAGTPYLAGSNQGFDTGLATLQRATGVSFREGIRTATDNPARLLNRSVPTIERGELANFVLLRPTPNLVEIVGTCVDGRWFEPERT